MMKERSRLAETTGEQHNTESGIEAELGAH